MCDRIAVMNHGRIVQVGSPVDIYRRPETRFVARLVGRATGRTRGAGGKILSGADSVEARNAALSELFIRPQPDGIVPAAEPVAPTWHG